MAGAWKSSRSKRSDQPQLTPLLALLLVHDHLLSKSGIALPQSHGLRQVIERYKARLASELTRARLRRGHPTLDALRQAVLTETRPEEEAYPRWVRVNSLKTDVDAQLESTFRSYERVYSVPEVLSGERRLYIDEHVPGLLAVSPRVDLTKTEAYKSGGLILQDKASCFPAYILDPSTDGDVVDACAAPGNKTTHLAAILQTRAAEGERLTARVLAFEKDTGRAKTLSKMVEKAGAKGIVRVGFGQDFLKVDPRDARYANVRALLLDPSCSGSGIVGRDSAPELHLPEPPAPPGQKGRKKPGKGEEKKRKREDGEEKPTVVDDEGNVQTLKSEQELAQRLRALSAFQLTLLLHAFEFPAARRVSYSTCSVHVEENEGVVVAALASDVAKSRGWRVLRREEQVGGMREWPVRGEVEGCGGDGEVAEACVRSYKGDGRGVMGFFVVAFVREGKEEGAQEDGPYVRDEEGRIVRDQTGMPMLKATGEFAAVLEDEAKERSADDDGEGGSGSEESGSAGADSSGSDASGDDDSEEEWGGFDD